jgi:hypothetical protein
MWRLTKLCDVWYAKALDLDDDGDIHDIQCIVEEGEMVTITDDVDYFADEFDVDIHDIVMVD